jgi:two-component system, OmpR family, heavy metal sensor histidine kinase CusS
MTISLRWRLLSGVVLGTGVLLTLFCITVYSLTSRMLVRHFDESLLDTARLLSAIIEDKGFVQEDGEQTDEEDSERTDRIERELDLEFNVRMTPEFFNLQGGAYYQFWTRDGTKTIRSPSLGQEDLPAFDEESDNSFYGDCALPGAKPGRAIRYRFIPQMDEDNQAREDPVTLVVARNAGELLDFLGLFRWLLIGSSAGILLLSTGVALIVSGAGLRPIHALAGAIRTVNEQTLDQSFPAEAYPVELRPICDCLNALLLRIGVSFERERRFNADVAHELRTPLAGIQTTLEVNLVRRRNPEEYQQALRDCLAIARSMQKMVDTLLSLSRLDSQKLAVRRQSVGLRELVEDRWRLLADRAYDRGLSFENRIGPDIRCATDPDHLSMILSNLLDNAVDYTNEGGRVWIETVAADPSQMVSLSNTGCTLPPEAADRVFDCFWRQDGSRTDAGKHCGVGLAVVRKIGDALGIALEAKVEPGGIFTIRLTIPADAK